MLGETNWYLFRFKARHADLRIDPRETILIKGNWRGRLSKVNRYRKLLINSADPRDYPSPGFVPARILIFRPLTVFVAAIEAIEIDLSDVQLISLPPSKKRPITSIFFSFSFIFSPLQTTWDRACLTSELPQRYWRNRLRFITRFLADEDTVYRGLYLIPRSASFRHCRLRRIRNTVQLDVVSVLFPHPGRHLHAALTELLLWYESNLLPDHRYL